MRARPFFVIGLTSFLAVLACSVLPLVGAVAVMLLLLLAGGAVIVLRRYPDAKVMMIALTAALLLCGSFLLKHTLFVYPTLRYAENTAYMTMRVEETIAVGERYIVKTVGGDLPKGIRLCLWTEGKAIPIVGDMITAQTTVTAAWDKLNDADGTYAKANGIYLYAFIDDAVPLEWQDGSADRSIVETFLYTLRETIHDTFYRKLSYADAALCESMLLGIRDNLSPTVETDFRVCGVYHLLVVSGLHLTLIAGVILKVLRALRVPRVIGVAAAMGATVLFAALCGFGASVTRACCMMLIMLAAQLFYRDSDGLNSLGLAAVIMLAIDPFCIYDRGWQLSFAATLGILLILPIWEKEVTARIKVGWFRPLVSAVGVSLSATLMTQPIISLYFGEVSLVFLLGNVLCVTVSSILLVLCLLSFAVMGIPLINDAFYGLIHMGCSFLTSTTAWIAQIPFASVAVREPFAVWWMFALAAVLAISYVLFKMRGVMRSLAMMVSVLFICVTVFVFCDSGVSSVHVFPTQTTAFAVDTKDSRGLVFEGDAATFKQVALQMESNGVRHLDWLLWLNTPFDSEMDVTHFSLSIDSLITLDTTSKYERLPSASQYKVLGSGETIVFSEQASLARDRDAYYLRIGQTKLLLCPKTYRAMALAEDWEETDIAIVRGTVPRDLKALGTDKLIVYTSYSPYYEKRLPRVFETVHYAMEDGALCIQTRGYGDITLRDD